MRGSRSFRIKALSAVLIPIVLSAIVTTTVAVSSSSSLLGDRAAQFGGAIADQLAISVADQLVQHDLLGLNVTLGNLLAKGDFSFASVYSADNRLLAQAGKSSAGMSIYTRDVVFQNAAAGYVQVGLAERYVNSPATTILVTSILVHLILISIVTLFGWSYADMVYLWLTGPGTPAPARETESRNAATTEAEPPPMLDRATILVAKIRPARLLATYEAAVTTALSLYGGDVDITGGGDFVVTFRARSQVFDAIRSAMLVRALMASERGQPSVKLGLHTTPSADGIEKSIKQATYMASMSNNQLLTSKEINEYLGGSDQVTLQEFHGSLAAEGEVYCLDAMAGHNEELIRRQAKQLLDNLHRR